MDNIVLKPMRDCNQALLGVGVDPFPSGPLQDLVSLQALGVTCLLRHEEWFTV